MNNELEVNRAYHRLDKYKGNRAKETFESTKGTTIFIGSQIWPHFT